MARFSRRLAIVVLAAALIAIIGWRCAREWMVKRNSRMSFEERFVAALRRPEGIDVEFEVFDKEGQGHPIVRHITDHAARTTLASEFQTIASLQNIGPPSIVGPARLSVRSPTDPNTFAWFVWPDRAYVFDAQTMNVVAVLKIDAKFMTLLWATAGANEALRERRADE